MVLVLVIVFENITIELIFPNLSDGILYFSVAEKFFDFVVFFMFKTPWESLSGKRKRFHLSGF